MSGLVESFEVRSIAVDERRLAGESPDSYAIRLAIQKAEAVAESLDSGLVVGADTIVVLGDELLAKPADTTEARSHLRRLRGRWHRVATAIAVIDAAVGQSIADIEWTDVRIRDFSDQEMSDYIATGDPFDKAGAYAIQDQVFKPVAELRGNEDNVIGLPCDMLSRLLQEARLQREVGEH
jgi:MAF protein